MTAPSRFSVADVKRAVKVAEALGMPVRGWEIAPDGTIRVLTGASIPANDRNPLDRVLRQ